MKWRPVILNPGDLLIINASFGYLAGTIDLNGMPQYSVTDGKGKIWLNL
jgi:hypothetical protein